MGSGFFYSTFVIPIKETVSEALQTPEFLTVIPVPDQVRDDGSGIQGCLTSFLNWRPDQVRHDKSATSVHVYPLKPLKGL